MAWFRGLRGKLFATFVFVLLVAVIYLSGIGCPSRWLLGIICPGCGMTRAYLAVMRLDFAAAFDFHPLFPVVPLMYLYFLKDGRLFGRVADTVVLCTVGAVFIIRWLIILFLL